ncbi:Ubiquitin carboxyl-terminal hydrolase 35 [Mortierella claussenii]|nr:Ubiquitin carboxyl-terminal hydrolase 35 [Mortierella claussenii]
METLIKGILAQDSLQDQVKGAAIAKLLTGIASLSTPDASVLLDLALQLKTTSRTHLENQTGDRILLAASIAHRILFWARFHRDWFASLVSGTATNQEYLRNVPLIISVARRKEATALTGEDKRGLEGDMEVIQSFADQRCISAVPALDYTVQNLDSTVLWRLKFTIQRLINWLVTIDLPAIWVVAIMESLVSRGEFALLRDLTDENAYKIARQLAFKTRRQDALLVTRFMLLGYYHSPILFHNIVQGFMPLLVQCRKSPEDIAFAREVSNLAQTLVIHFGDTDDIGTKIQKTRNFLDLPIVSRSEALRTMLEYSWKKTLQIQNTSAGFRRKPAFSQPLGKVGLVNLGNSCFMNSALRALFCSVNFKQAILNDTAKVDSSKVMTTKLRETFIGLSTPRLSVVTPSALYKALPDWLNDGHQQDAAEFTKILFSRMEDEDPVSKRALGSFHGTLVNQVKCGTCATVSSNKEDFYDLAVPLPRSVSLPLNLIISLNRFEFDVQRSRRIKINTPIQLTDSIEIMVQDRHEIQSYDLYAVVIHTGDSANHGHYYTYAKNSTGKSEDEGTWLLYNDTRITISSFEDMQQSLAGSRADTPYMLFFGKTDKPTRAVVQSIRSKRSSSNL